MGNKQSRKKKKEEKVAKKHPKFTYVNLEIPLLYPSLSYKEEFLKLNKTNLDYCLLCSTVSKVIYHFTEREKRLYINKAQIIVTGFSCSTSDSPFHPQENYPYMSNELLEFLKLLPTGIEKF